MFTGLVETLGQVAGIEEQGDAIRMSITAPDILGDAGLGDSISVNGVCLTVAELDEERRSFTADVMHETINRSALSRLGVGAAVNLERALAVGDRLGGHIMQGHVDGTATLVSRERSENWDLLRFRIGEQLRRYVVEKGSVALDGTSLTVSAVGGDWLEVSLIPTTLAETTHGELAVGDEVNVEVDVLAKYVENMLRGGQAGPVRGQAEDAD